MIDRTLRKYARHIGLSRGYSAHSMRATLPAATASHTPAADSQSSKESTAVTLRLDRERYRSLVSYGARFMPRRTNQEILIEALDAYLNQVEQSSAS